MKVSQALFSVAVVVCLLNAFDAYAASEPSAPEVATTSPSKSVALTIYNQDFAVVKDVREVDLKSGINLLRFEDVAAKIDPTTVSFQSLNDLNAIVVKEQNYQYDLINPATILAKSIGKEIKFTDFTSAGQTHEVSGILLSAPNVVAADNLPRYSGLVVKTADGIVLNPSGQAEVASMPEGLLSKPSLLWKVEAKHAGSQQAEIAYQTSGLNWHCDYVCLDNTDDNKVDLNAWVTIDNKCGASFNNASLKLLAGDVHLVQPRPQMRMMALEAAANQSQFSEAAFSEYHLYALSGTTDVKDNETKQLSLFAAAGAPCTKLLVYEAQPQPHYFDMPVGDASKVKVKLEIVNSAQNHLGMPLPAGRVRVYKKDADGALQFIGEDKIDHTPRDEKIRIYLGDAFDIVGEHTQTNVQEISNQVRRLSYDISLRNHKDSDETVTTVEHGAGQWKILNSTATYTKKDAHTFEFVQKVPANGEVKISYTIEEKL